MGSWICSGSLRFNQVFDGHQLNYMHLLLVTRENLNSEKIEQSYINSLYPPLE